MPSAKRKTTRCGMFIPPCACFPLSNRGRKNSRRWAITGPSTRWTRLRPRSTRTDRACLFVSPRAPLPPPPFPSSMRVPPHHGLSRSRSLPFFLFFLCTSFAQLVLHFIFGMTIFFILAFFFFYFFNPSPPPEYT
jgi:hypothetical protein